MAGDLALNQAIVVRPHASEPSMGDRLMAGRVALDHVVQVRVLLSQPPGKSLDASLTV